MSIITREDAFGLLKKYNEDPFHLQHAITVEAVMRWYAKEEGYETKIFKKEMIRGMELEEDVLVR